MTKHTEHMRVLDVEGAYNARDLGGYETRDGICGVPRETIIEDYGLTAQYLVRRYYEDNPDVNPDAYTWREYQNDVCHPHSMQITLDHLDRMYGGVEGYLRDTGITDDQVAAIKEAMTE